MIYIFRRFVAFFAEIFAFISGALAFGSFYGGSYFMGIILLCFCIPSAHYSINSDNFKNRKDFFKSIIFDFGIIIIVNIVLFFGLRILMI